MFQRTTDEISFYPTDLFLTEFTHNSFKDLQELDWETKEEMRCFIEERMKLETKKLNKNRGK